jgi:glycosyltransferase involved in cell wall biosynthesis
MKVLYLTTLPPSHGGAQIAAKRVALAVARAGHEIAIVCQRHCEVSVADGLPNRRYRFRAAAQRDLIDAGVRLYPAFDVALVFNRDGGAPPRGAESLVRRLVSILRAERPDLMHLHFPSRRIAEATAAAAATGTPLVTTVHGMTDLRHDFENPMLGRMTTAEAVAWLAGHARVIAVSTEIAAFLRAQGLSRVE